MKSTASTGHAVYEMMTTLGPGCPLPTLSWTSRAQPRPNRNWIGPGKRLRTSLASECLTPGQTEWTLETRFVPFIQPQEASALCSLGSRQ